MDKKQGWGMVLLGGGVIAAVVGLAMLGEDPKKVRKTLQRELRASEIRENFQDGGLDVVSVYLNEIDPDVVVNCVKAAVEAGELGREGNLTMKPMASEGSLEFTWTPANGETANQFTPDELKAWIAGVLADADVA